MKTMLKNIVVSKVLALKLHLIETVYFLSKFSLAQLKPCSTRKMLHLVNWGTTISYSTLSPAAIIKLTAALLFVAKGRRLLEILRIFGTLHFVKQCIPRRYSASTTYQWVGADAAINYLNRLSGKQTSLSDTST